MDRIKEIIECNRTDEVLRLTEDKSARRSIAANINLDTGLQ